VSIDYKLFLSFLQAILAVEQAAARVADLSAAAAVDPITADAMAIHDSLRDVRAAATAGNANATSSGTRMPVSYQLSRDVFFSHQPSLHKHSLSSRCRGCRALERRPR
jgi:hypothetical protein